MTSIDTQITDFLPLLGKDEKKTILSFIKSYIKKDKSEERISIKQYNRELDAAEKEYENGNYITQAELRKEIEQW